MKKNLLLLSCLFLAMTGFAQEEEDEYEMYPTSWFVRCSPAIFAINSFPATIDFKFIDDDFVQPDSAFVSFDTDKMWSYGFNAELSYMFKNEFTLSHNAFMGLGSKGMFTYYSQVSIGKEMIFGQFYVQPRLGVGYIYSQLKIDDFYSDNKGYFEINNRYIYDDMKVRLKSRTFAVSPSVIIEYPIKEYLTIFGQINGFYSFGRRSYLSFTGITDEYNEEGEAITAYENRDFNGYGVDFSINGQQLLSRQSPYLHYNFNTISFQIGVGIQLMQLYYD